MLAVCALVLAGAAAAAASAPPPQGVFPMPSVPLVNSAWPNTRMPVLGLGVGAYGTKPNATFPNGTRGEYWTNSSCAVAVQQWLDMNGTRVDTSLKWYHDLAGVGWGMRNSSVPRSNVFVTSKVDDPYGYNTTIQHFTTLLETLCDGDVDSDDCYVDLLLAHWPGPTYFLGHTHAPTYCHTHGPTCRQQTWLALQEILKTGKARAVGVANYEERHLEDILKVGPPPAVNQFEFHPYWHEDDLAAYCRTKKIVLNSYAPLGAPDFMAWQPEKWPVLIPNHPTVQSIAAAVQRTPAQVLIQWNLQNNFVANPRTNKPEHMADNLAVVGVGGDPFTLSPEQFAALGNLTNIPAPSPRNKVCPDPHIVP